MGLGTHETSSWDLSNKMSEIYYYLYKHHLVEFDWFMKADTDTYVVAENLRYMLSDYKTSQAIFFGQHFRVSLINK